ncbi:MAG: hypothetical protein CMJ78_26315, partial [Planctomycetaceae bacterium]|nr:hypothetical protein [Planctomycetaceae bacterium]
IRKIQAQIPVPFENDVLTTGKRMPLPLAASVLGFHHYNPEHPKRLVYVVSPYLEAADRSSFLKNPRHFLAGSEGFKMIDQPDLLVRGIDRRLRREMQFDKNWKYLDASGHDKLVPAKFADRKHLALAHMKVMHKQAKVDFAFWWGPEDKGLFGGYDFNWLIGFDPHSYTTADYLVRRRETETMTAVLTASEFRDIFSRWIKTNELITYPEISEGSIEDNRSYRIVIPMDMVPKLGIRRKVLGNVAIGPDIMPKDVAAEFFK